MKHAFIAAFTVLILLIFASIARAAFWDVSRNSLYSDAITYLQEKEIVKGYADGTFKPNDHINRYDFLKIVIAYVYPKSVIDNCVIEDYRFADVPRGHWSEPYLCVAKRDGVVNGYANGMFGGDDLVRLSEAVKITLESLEIPLATGNFTEWYQPYLQTANSLSLLADISQDPLYKINRGEMALLVYRLRDTDSTSSATTMPTPVASSSPRSTPTNTSTTYKSVLATIFWAGEGSDASNGYITNVMSAWDDDWLNSFGGYDDPDDRCGSLPCKFTPKENPFYFALPYNDLDDNGERKSNAALVPWFEETKQLQTIIKNRWIEVVYSGNTCYGQWQDVGPYLEDDFEYVFGNAEPSNTFGLQAGIDLSPAMRDCLTMNDNEIVGWRFVDDNEVPTGPWKDIVTTSNVNW